MDYLLDTHTLIWFLNGDEQLSKKSLSIIEDIKSTKFVSIISLWEIALKIGLGKLEFDGGAEEISNLIELNGFEILPLSIYQIIQFEKLEFIHRDPFDRLLIGQAQAENLGIITRDGNINKYNVKTIW